MEIRKLKPNEFYALRDLLDEVFTRHNKRDTIFEKEFPRIFGEPNEYCTSSHIGAFDGDRLIGTAAMYPIDYVIGGVHVKLIANGNVAVHEDYRGRGVMMSLLQKINEECDKIGDVGYLHGKAERYGKVGYFSGGVQYLCTLEAGEKAGYEFAAVQPEEIDYLMELSTKRTDYIVRSKKDFLPALHSRGREALTVFKNGIIVGYVSLARKSGFVEEFAIVNDDEPGVFKALANEIGAPVTVRLSGYEVKTFEKIKACVKDSSAIKQSEPALFRIINAEPLKAGARALGLDESVIYAPYLT